MPVIRLSPMVSLVGRPKPRFVHFQTAHGLQIDGIVGPETSGRLLELMAIPMPGSAATVVPELELTPMVSNPALNAASEILMINTEAGLPETSAGRKALAAEASRIATMRNTTGRCYAGVADAVDAKESDASSGACPRIWQLTSLRRVQNLKRST